jgi:DNA-binding transcriptional ArsR family regulator
MANVTKKEKFAKIANLLADHEDIVEFCNHEIDLLSRKRSTTKPTKTQRENEGIKERILATLTEEPMTIGEINAAMETEYSPQKMSALLKQLVDTKKVIKDTIGKVPYFSLAE